MICNGTNEREIRMEVILKKTKITNSLLKQVLLVSLWNLTSYDVLGWCVYDKKRWIILYHSLTHDIRKYPLIFKIVETLETQNDYKVKVSFVSKFDPLNYEDKTEKEQHETYEKLRWLKEQSEIKGQFFI